ncbi:uncharacterized protein PAC_13192 [Phialocephala subalpina]|uniref:DNA polymerase delta subunit 3 n=1 Tax=Phialocephala subalpina TaxID=576137 RepID=A0A1L7XE41_9HELO|nr:uncharacterized protein PAC_13192 [Phialocephala subalpina]
MADYKTYLASSILTEDKIVTYRLLSRALKVNVNAAKEMLYEFHREQNGRKPGTIHATYLISGTKRKEPEPTNGAAEQDGEDTHMQSSLYFSSSMPQPEESIEESGVLSITLVREENLEEVRSQYEHITSVHVYSIGPHQLKDLQILSDITRQVRELTADDDPIETASQYGTITNKNVRRRKGTRPPPAATPAPIPTKTAPTKPKQEVKTSIPPLKQEVSSTAKDFFGKSKATAAANTSSKDKATASNISKESTPNPPNLKRDNSSIFKSFAKAKPKLKREGTDSSAAADSPAISAAEDSPMKDVSDDEEETYVPPAPANTEIVAKSRRERKENEERLKKMMDMSDEEEDIKEETPIVEEKEKEKEASPEKEVVPVVSGERRRGRRRVMKKKTVKDEEGYLVTKEEPVWESFSEDEPAPAPKPKVHAPAASTKAKKGAAKQGQGSIMSFFGKK